MSRKVATAVILSLLTATAAYAQTNRAGINSNITPIVPDRQIGLPDKAAPAEGQNVVTPNATTRPSRANPIAAPAQAQTQAPAQPQAQKQAAAEYGEWRLECIEKAAKPNCQASVRAMIGEQIALVLSVARPAKSQETLMQLAVPLGMTVSKGVDVKIGEYTANFPISRCTAQGCLVEGAFPAAFADALKSAKEGTVSIYSSDGKAVQLPLPAKSFTTAYDGISSTN